MIDAVKSLILDLFEWVANGERSYEEVMDAWRTSCPGLPVWEDANDRGLVTREYVNGRYIVRITSSGLALLEQRRPLLAVKRHDRVIEMNAAKSDTQI
ncbi:MAG: hypothetical protein ABR953_03570 [Candidatus Acidiferrales bacterium]|jgi:hypothetical protein